MDAAIASEIENQSGLPLDLIRLCIVYSRDSPEEIVIKAGIALDEAFRKVSECELASLCDRLLIDWSLVNRENEAIERKKVVDALASAKSWYKKCQSVLVLSQRRILPYQAIDYMLNVSHYLLSVDADDVEHGLFSVLVSVDYTSTTTSTTTMPLVVVFKESITFDQRTVCMIPGEQTLHVDFGELTNNQKITYHKSLHSILNTFADYCKMELSTVQRIFGETPLTEISWNQLVQREINPHSIILLTLISDFYRRSSSFA